MRDAFDDLPAEHAEIGELLVRGRAQLTASEVERVKARAMAPRARVTSRKGTIMRSRLAIVAILASGLVMSGGGAALGVSALTSTENASVAQYGRDVAPTSPETDVRGDVLGGGGAQPEEGAQPPTQVTRQVESGAGGSLPFTGYAAIPVLLAGLALLSTGLILRRSVRRSPDAAA